MLRIPNNRAHAAIRLREDFQGSNLRAAHYRRHPGMSVLPADWRLPSMGVLPAAQRRTLAADFDLAGALGEELYVVYSYATPIAWYAPSFGWVVPDVKCSPTTSRHQSRVRLGVAQYAAARERVSA